MADQNANPSESSGSSGSGSSTGTNAGSAAAEAARSSAASSAPSTSQQSSGSGSSGSGAARSSPAVPASPTAPTSGSGTRTAATASDVERFEKAVDRLEKTSRQKGRTTPRNVQREIRPEDSTVPVPEVRTADQPVARRRSAARASTLPIPPSLAANETSTGEPIVGYNKMTVGEILKAAKAMEPEGRTAVLNYEREHGNRATLIDALVNWNS